MIKKYLDQHMGDAAFQYLENLKNHLSSQGMNDLIHRIDVMMKEKYHDRPRLTDLFGS